MKSIAIFLFVYIIQIVNSQNLPYEFHFSNDGYSLICGNTEPIGFYNMESIDTIYLDFQQTNYWTLLTNNYASKTDIPATLTYKGKEYDSVGVRFKGMTSYQRLGDSDKKSFNISMDYVKDQDIDGYKTFNLNNNYEDPSRLREFLYLYFNRKHIPAAKANYVILMINGQSWGIYTNVQQLNKQHAREWFDDADVTRWRAEGENSAFGGGGMPGGPGGIRPGGGSGGGGGFGAGTSSLNYLGDDTSSYQEYYTLKNAYKDNPWEDLVLACKVLNSVSKDSLIDTLNKIMDVDGVLWFLAQEILFTDDDSYVHKGSMDYCVYFDVGTNRLVPIEYDGNTTFITKEAASWSPFYNEDNTNFPLLNILLSVPELRQRYLAHVRTIMNEAFNSEKTDSLIDKYASLINTYVNNDPKKLYSYNQFKTGINDLKNFIKNRNTYLSSNSEINKTPPAISSVIFKSDNENFSLPDNNETVTVNARVSHESGIAEVNLYYGTGIMGSFIKIPMFDDGAHHDNTAGDHVYGAEIPAFEKSTLVRFYIEAVDATANGSRSYSPEGAEHDVYVYRVKVADKIESDVVINEIMASNSIYASDQDGEYDDWIELYNNSFSTIDLSGYYLTDNSSKLKKWKFPEGTAIEGGGYLIIWADNDTLQDGLHANFKLSASGEEVLLVTPDVLIADEVIYNEQNTELAFARMENGTGSFTWQLPTYNSENIKIIVNVQRTLVNREVFVYPNPASDYINIEIDDFQGNASLYIYDIYGKIILCKSFNSYTTIDVSGYSDGIYIISIDNCIYKRVVFHH